MLKNYQSVLHRQSDWSMAKENRTLELLDITLRNIYGLRLTLGVHSVIQRLRNYVSNGSEQRIALFTIYKHSITPFYDPYVFRCILSRSFFHFIALLWELWLFKNNPCSFWHNPYNECYNHKPCDVWLSRFHNLRVVPETSEVVSFLEADDIEFFVSTTLDGR